MQTQITLQDRIKILLNIIDFLKRYNPNDTDGVYLLHDIIDETDLLIENTSPR